MPGTFHMFNFHNIPGRIIIPVLQMRQLRHRLIKKIVHVLKLVIGVRIQTWQSGFRVNTLKHQATEIEN